MVGGKIANFQIVEELGSGGMGTVYKARDINLKRFVAIKVLNPGLLEKENNYKRFKNEAEISAQINHPNVATLYNFLEINGHAYIVMEFVNGVTLEDLIEEKGPLNKHQAIDITTQILKGISAAHQLNILHRDLKPANIMISRNGYVKIMDFGIALMQNSTRLTTHNKVIGTLNYMAPELFSGRTPTVGSDLYAVGVLFFEMLSGNALFNADSEANLMYQILHKKPQFDLKSNKQSLTPILKKLVQKTPSKRFPSAEKVVHVLSNTSNKPKVTPKIDFPDLKPALKQIKRKFRVKTNFAKQANVIKVSTSEKARLKFSDLISQRFLLLCLILTTIIVIVSANIKSSSPEITSGVYEEDLSLEQDKDEGVSSLKINQYAIESQSIQPPPSDEVVFTNDNTSTEKPTEIKNAKKQITSKKEVVPVPPSRKTKQTEAPVEKPVAETVNTKVIKADEVKPSPPLSAPIEQEVAEETQEVGAPSDNTIKEAIARKVKTEVFLREQKMSIRFSNEVKSSDYKVGQEILLETVEGISSNNVLIVAKSAKVRATVSKKRISNSGKVTFGLKFNQVRAVNGEWISLKYPEYSDINKGEVIFEKGRVVNRVTVLSKKLILML